jgi:hypothetical protein
VGGNRIVMSELNNLSRVALLDYKRNGLSDVAIATLYGSEPRLIATRRHQLGVPALACDVSLSAPVSKVRSKPERTTKERPIGTGHSTKGFVQEDEPMRTTDEAEAHLSAFFARRPNFSADNVRTRPARRLTMSAATIVGTGASALYGA